MTPYDEGFEAYWAERGAQTCPYENDSIEQAEWLAGFNAAYRVDIGV